jgi:hypothetical protein
MLGPPTFGERTVPWHECAPLFGQKFLSSAETIPAAEPHQGPAPDPSPRVIESSDIGGTDPDDIRSMVHSLLYADMFDVDGILSSP